MIRILLLILTLVPSIFFTQGFTTTLDTKSWDKEFNLENFDYKLWHIDDKDFTDPRRWPI